MRWRAALAALLVLLSFDAAFGWPKEQTVSGSVVGTKWRVDRGAASFPTYVERKLAFENLATRWSSVSHADDKGLAALKIINVLGNLDHVCHKSSVTKIMFGTNCNFIYIGYSTDRFPIPLPKIISYTDIIIIWFIRLPSAAHVPFYFNFANRLVSFYYINLYFNVSGWKFSYVNNPKFDIRNKTKEVIRYNDALARYTSDLT